MGRNLLFDMWDRLLCVLFHSDLGTFLKFYILFCEDISYQPFIQVQYSCFTNTAEVHEGAILPLSVEDFSSWGTADYLFNSTHNSTQHNNLGQEGKNCAHSMRQSDNCCITTDTEIWNLTGTLGPGTPLILMLCLWNSLAPVLPISWTSASPPDRRHHIHVLASCCSISFSTRLALAKMIMEILILKFSLLYS